MIPLLDSSDHHRFNRSSPTFITSENVYIRKSPKKNKKDRRFPLEPINRWIWIDGPPGLGFDGHPRTFRYEIEALKASLKASTMFPWPMLEKAEKVAIKL